MSNQAKFVPSRRTLLKSAGAGFGHLALAGLLGQAAAKAATSKPLSPRPPHFPAKAKRIIFLFMEGAISSLDTFEYKPEIERSAGKSGPGGGVITPSPKSWCKPAMRGPRHGSTSFRHCFHQQNSDSFVRRSLR